MNKSEPLYTEIKNDMTMEEKIKISREKINRKSIAHLPCQSEEERKERRRQTILRCKYRRYERERQLNLEIQNMRETLNQLGLNTQNINKNKITNISKESIDNLLHKINLDKNKL